MSKSSRDQQDPGRWPPVAVRRQLAEEVGFGCPVEGCGSPYLTWHHFDPPWATRHHHEPAGMVAICRDHHSEADAGAFTMDQLRAFKGEGRDRSQLLGARFSWMRERLLAVVGGNFYYETAIAIRVQDIPVVWFNRDESGRLLVNLQMITTSAEPRMLMYDNFWMTEGSSEREIECPPSGRRVSAKYPNGDQLKVKFREAKTLEDFDRHYKPPQLPNEVRERFEMRGMTLPELPTSHAESLQRSGIELPVATVEITMKVAGADLELGPKGTAIGTNQVTGSWFIRSQVGVQIGDPAP